MTPKPPWLLEIKWAFDQASGAGAADPQYTQQGHPSMESLLDMASLALRLKSLALVSLRIASATPFFHQKSQLARRQGLNIESFAILDEVVDKVTHLLGVVHG